MTFPIICKCDVMGSIYNYDCVYVLLQRFILIMLLLYLRNLRENWTKKSLLVYAQPRFVLNMFLFLQEFQPQCSYKIVLIKEKGEGDITISKRFHFSDNPSLPPN